MANLSVTHSDNSSFSSNFVEVTAPTMEGSVSVPSNQSSSSQLQFTPVVSGSNPDSEKEMAHLDTSTTRTSRPHAGSMELPRLETRLSHDQDQDHDLENDDLQGEEGDARNYVAVSADGYEEDEYDSELEYKSRHRLRRQSSVGAGAGVGYTAEEEKEIVKRLDKRLVLFLALLYMLSFLDRSSKCYSFLRLRRKEREKKERERENECEF